MTRDQLINSLGTIQEQLVSLAKVEIAGLVAALKGEDAVPPGPAGLEPEGRGQSGANEVRPPG